MVTDKNDPVARGETSSPYAEHGLAALLLVESLIHGLREKSVLTTTEAASVVQTAIDVQLEYADTTEGSDAPMWRSHQLLLTIAASLAIDDKVRPTLTRVV